jgi:hypothetical protein
MLFFSFCPLSRKEKEIVTQRSLRLERAQRVGGEKFYQLTYVAQCAANKMEIIKCSQ